MYRHTCPQCDLHQEVISTFTQQQNTHLSPGRTINTELLTASFPAFHASWGPSREVFMVFVVAPVTEMFSSAAEMGFMAGRRPGVTGRSRGHGWDTARASSKQIHDLRLNPVNPGSTRRKTLLFAQRDEPVFPPTTSSGSSCPSAESPVVDRRKTQETGREILRDLNHLKPMGTDFQVMAGSDPAASALRAGSDPAASALRAGSDPAASALRAGSDPAASALRAVSDPADLLSGLGLIPRPLLSGLGLIPRPLLSGLGLIPRPLLSGLCLIPRTCSQGWV
uniref:Uncharacterized protein n=1 Tax=Branchiostoma floridae TaxID=7739 RepID=C3YGT3_BRAFL|eukprot:XP_002604393.1 hypothetical protein BRAFLDRAFT_79304 [Branchiostoma floridae]